MGTVRRTLVVGMAAALGLVIATRLEAEQKSSDSTICPTLPGTNFRDYSKPCYKTDGNYVYPTLPGTSIRDYSRPGYRVDENEAQPTMPGTKVRDYSLPGYRIDQDEIQPTLPGTSVRDYSRRGYRREGDEICPTVPGTSFRDYTRPCYKVEGDTVRPSGPQRVRPEEPPFGLRENRPENGLSQWWSPQVEPIPPARQPRRRAFESLGPAPTQDCSSVPGFCFDGREFFPVLPGTATRDYTRAGAVIQGGALCPTLPGTSVRDFGRDCVPLEK